MAAGRPPVIMETDGTERTTYDGLSCLPGGRPNSAVSVSAGPPAGEGDRALIVFSSSPRTVPAVGARAMYSHSRYSYGGGVVVAGLLSAQPCCACRCSAVRATVTPAVPQPTAAAHAGAQRHRPGSSPAEPGFVSNSPGLSQTEI